MQAFKMTYLVIIKLFRSVMQDSAENKTNTIKAIKNIRQMNMDKMRNVKMMS